MSSEVNDARSERRFIAAGFYHSFAIGFHDEDTEEPKSDSEGRETAGHHAQVHAFGGNRNRVLGIACPFFCTDCKKKGRQIDETSPAQSPREQLHTFDRPTALQTFKHTSIFQVSCGSNHTVFLEKREGQLGGYVWSCGLGQKGRLGVEKPETMEDCVEFLKQQGCEKKHVNLLAEQIMKFPQWSFPRPVRVSFPDEIPLITHVTCGMDHTLALSSQGVLWAWGCGSYGNLGDGSTCDRVNPVRVPFGDENVICRSAAAGAKHSLATSTDGRLYSWGHGGNGRLGHLSFDAVLTPKLVTSHDIAKMSVVAAGDAHSSSIDVFGNVWCWGAGSYGRCGHEDGFDLPEPSMLSAFCTCAITSVELGSLHSLALAADGVVFAWGFGSATGVLELVGSDIQAVPKAVDFKSKQILQIAAGSFHSLALQASGKVFAWGAVGQGRLGVEKQMTATDIGKPVVIEGFRCGEESELSRIFCSKSQAKRRLLADWEMSEGREGKSDIVMVWCGGAHSAAITSENELYLWGSNEYGQMGVKRESLENMWEPSRMAMPSQRSKIAAIVLGLNHCIALTTARKVLTWGCNEQGQLGLGTLTNQSKPVLVAELEDVLWIAAGWDHSAATTMTGELMTWGAASGGKLGHGASLLKGVILVPRTVAFDSQVAVVSCGEQHTALIDRSGNIVTCGVGYFGRLGHGSLTNMNRPKHVEQLVVVSNGVETRVADSVSMTDLQCGSFHTVALSADKRVWQCGRDLIVCAGDHVLTFTCLELHEHADDQSASQAEVTAIAVGPQHTFAISTKGTLWAWGDNRSKQLSYPDEDHIDKPKIIYPKNAFPGDERLVSIATAGAHTLALTNKRRVYAWGASSGGRLGIKLKEEAKYVNSFRKPCVVKGLHERKELQHSAPTAGTSTAKNAVKNEPGALAIKNAVEEDEHEYPSAELTARAEPTTHETLATLTDEIRNKNAADELNKEHQELEAICQTAVKSLLSLWEKPTQTEGTGASESLEWQAQELRSKLDISVCRSLRHMELDSVLPTLEPRHYIVSQRLVQYEELVFLLQQHPCYIARLAEKLSTVTGAEDDPSARIALITRVTANIFKELENERINNLFMAFLRVLMEKEIQTAMTVAKPPNIALFHPDRSIVCLLLRDSVSNVFFKEYHAKLFDAGAQDSLISLVYMWTHNVKPPKDKHKDWKDHHHIDAKDNNDSEEPKRTMWNFRLTEVENSTVSGLEESIHQFCRFVGNVGGADRKTLVQFFETLDLPKSMEGFWKVFRYIIDIKPKSGDHHMTWVAGCDGSTDAGERRDSDGESPLLTEIVQCVAFSFVGHVLENPHKFMSSKFTQALKDICRQRVMEKSPDLKMQEQVVDAHTISMERSVMFNMKQVGKFLRCLAYEDSDLPPGVKLEAKEFKAKCLKAFVKKAVAGVQDKDKRDPEVVLFGSLYTMHYDTKAHYVCVASDDLLLLGDALWNHREAVIGLDHDNLKNSRMYKLLDQLQPPEDKYTEGDFMDRKPRNWENLKDFEEVQASRILHNFHINHRFLKAGDEPCICYVCKAPMPRSIAIDKHYAHKLPLIRPLRRQKGKYAKLFSELFDLLSNHDFPRLSKSSFGDAAAALSELEEKKRADSQGAGGTATFSMVDIDYLNSLKQGRRIMNLCRNSQDSRFAIFSRFVKDTLNEQNAYKDFLFRIKREMQSISEWQAEYVKTLEGTVKALARTHDYGFKYIIPEPIRQKAAEKAVKLKYEDARQTAKLETRDVERETGAAATLDANTSTTYSLLSLRAKSVIGPMTAIDLRPEDYRFIRFTLEHFESGDWHFTVTHRKHNKDILLSTFVILEKEVEEMKRAAKTAVKQYNGWNLNCFNLVQILTRTLSH